MNWGEIVIALIAAGLLKYAADGVKWLAARKQAGGTDARQALAISTADQSLTVVARARDELEADNARLRQQQAETDARHEADRARWELREAAMREEIDTLERKIRALLVEVEKMKDRHTINEVEARRMYPGAGTARP